MIINIFGDIASDSDVWLYQLFDIRCYSPGMLREALAQLPADEELIVEINSPGGSVWAGFELYSLLKACKSRTEAHLIAMAASAATTVMCGCDTVLASPVAQVMVHQPSVGVCGMMNNEDTRQLKQFLDSIKASIVNAYAAKAGDKTTRRKLEQLVDDSTWMPAQDAMAVGLVDGLLDLDEEEQERLAGALTLVRNGIDPGAPTALLERYEAAVRAGTIQEVPGHPVSRKTQQGANAAESEAAASAATAAADAAEAPAPADAGPAPDDMPAPVQVVRDTIDHWELQAAIDLARARARAE